AEGEGLQKAEAAAIIKLGDQAKRRTEVVEKRHDITAAQDGRGRRARWRPSRAGKGSSRTWRDKKTRAQGAWFMVEAATLCSIIEECDDLRGAHGARVTTAVERDEGADPVDVRLLGAG